MSKQAEFLPTVQALVQCYQTFERDSAAHIRAMGLTPSGEALFARAFPAHMAAGCL